MLLIWKSISSKSMNIYGYYVGIRQCNVDTMMDTIWFMSSGSVQFAGEDTYKNNRDRKPPL